MIKLIYRINVHKNNPTKQTNDDRYTHTQTHTHTHTHTHTNTNTS